MSTPSKAGPGDEGETWYATAEGRLRPGEEAAGTARGDTQAVARLLARIEDEVAAAPERCFAFAEDGEATLTVAGRTFTAGSFSTPTLGELRARVQARAGAGARGRLALSVLSGAHPLTDIGTLQGTAPPRTLFQVASQFNCLEAPGARVVPVREYIHDSTQGPRASVSAFPGTFLRHYRAPAADGSRFVQRNDGCLNLLGDALGPHAAAVRNGYLAPSGADLSALATALEARFDQIRVGMHGGVEVVFGHDWSGPVAHGPRRIAQVFTSAMALGGYGRNDGSPGNATVIRQLQRAAYLGTLLAALDLGCETVVLTMIGGGVFGNPHQAIWSAIHWALAEVEPYVRGTVQILANIRGTLADADRAQVRARGGVVVHFGPGGIEVQP